MPPRTPAHASPGRAVPSDHRLHRVCHSFEEVWEAINASSGPQDYPYETDVAAEVMPSRSRPSWAPPQISALGHRLHFGPSADDNRARTR